MAAPHLSTETTTTTDRRGRDRTPAQNVALALGSVFSLVGIIGFAITGFDQFADHHTGEHLLWFEINPLHNIVHLAFGVLGLVMAASNAGAGRYGMLVGVGYGGALIYGLAALDETWDILAINAADNWLHLILAIAGFGLAAIAGADAIERRPMDSAHTRR